ncbi:AraC family transcriptional regulator [Paenibacillus sp. VCA1]|uniref:helix-turn-helix transcriptional regulator n=1 Tax=Paenibacillus sp. VCA1 TaxID=3039148 RepID=UPI0028713419|nr:AraC family transcriptional regulator [Paenibacillus sp. VCA1]MDR9854919.1 AraC family transcriptional regulator [Paenibacillus sp. VCA1]
MNEEQIAAAEAAIRYMKEHLEDDVTSERLAAIVGYSPFHFSRIFKQATGISPRHYLSALRMEAGKSALLRDPSLLMKILLSIGFRSPGSFHTRFKQNVGMSPRKFRAFAQPLSSYVRQYELQEPIAEKEKPGIPSPMQQIRCRIEAPPSFRGIVFVGFFPSPIPDQRPAAGTAMNRSRNCTFTDVPPGVYHALAAGIPWSLNPKDYFILNHALRGKYPHPIQVAENSSLQVTISLREPLAVDPPIVVNLPLLLFEKKERNKAK